MAGRTHKLEGEGGGIAPLYDRLPRGPHQMGRGEVAENQRQRMLGAMVEAAAANGYGRTSVRQVVSLAGVSRRAFYEQFTNKQDCFLATLELIASRAGARVEEAYRAAGPDFGQRMAAALATYAELIGTNPKSAHLAVIDAPSAGAQGWAHLTKMLLAFERRLSASFLRTPGAIALPSGVVRGITGGLHRIAFTRLREGRAEEMAGLVDEILAWTLAMQAPGAQRLGARPRPAHAYEATDGSPALARPMGIGAPARIDERARILDSALEMAALEGYENLSPLRIVDHAGVSIDAFFNLFGGLETCFMEALLKLAEAAIASIRDPGLDSPDQWPLAVPRSLRALMSHFASNPTHAHMIATGAFEMGTPAVNLNIKLADVLARRLTQGAPDEPRLIEREATAGAIWHTIYCHAVSRQLERLPSVSDQLAYVILAPAIGGEEAVATLADRTGGRLDSPLGKPLRRLGNAISTARL